MGIIYDLKTKLDETEAKEPDTSDLGKGLVAVIELNKLYFMKEAIERCDVNLIDLFMTIGHETERKLLYDYFNGALCIKSALSELERVRCEAENYLRRRGYNPDLAEQHSKMLKEKTAAKLEFVSEWEDTFRRS